MNTTHDTLTSTDARRDRRSPRRKALWLLVPILAVVLVTIGLAAPAVTTSVAPAAGVDEATNEVRATTTRTGPGSLTAGATSDDAAVGSGGPTPTDGSMPDPAAPARLVVPSDLYPEPGDNGVVFLIGNDGGQPLTWSVPRDDGPKAVVQPENGVIAPGDSQLVGFEFPSPVLYADMVYPFTVESNGGTVEVEVHLDALDAVFEIVDGTWNIRNGNTFLVSYADMDIGLTLKNVGTDMLHVDPQEVDGLAVIGGPWDLAPGETAHLHLVLCNATYSGGIPDFHDRDFHIHTDSWQGTLDFGLRFTLAPDQSALPC